MDPLFIVGIGILVVLVSILVLRLHAFLALILASLFVGLLTTPETLHQYGLHSGMGLEQAEAYAGQSVGKRIATAFGNTAGKIGILIAMASIIGTCLLKSGGAERIIRSILKLFGEKRAPFAFLSSGFLLSIPVYFDTVFYLLIPIGRSMGIRFPKKFSLYVMTIVAGAVMAHSLVPPTPGPLFVADALGVDLGTMMLAGLSVGICTALAGYLFSLWANRHWGFPLRDTQMTPTSEMQALSETPEEELPSLGFSLLPILLPILLIAGNTILTVSLPADLSSSPVWQRTLLGIFQVVGESNFALILSAGLAILLMKGRFKETSSYLDFVSEALQSAGMIILITAAGGALGGILQQTGISSRIEVLALTYQVSLIPFAFFLAAIVRTVQGSATVAMITTVGVLGGLASSQELDFHPVYLALAVGCGSKLIPWMNDSGFWIVTQMTGMRERETLKHFSLLLAFMGLVGLGVTMLLAYIFPMI